MHRAAFAALALALGFSAPAYAQAPNTCVDCHAAFETGDQSPAHLAQVDVHAKRGISCADCHGGDPAAEDADAAMDPAKGFIVPERQAIPEFCARCHSDPAYMRRFNPNLPTDQYLKYQSSRHGMRNAEGDQDVAVCTSCHGAHGIRQKNDPLAPVFPANIPATCAQCHSDAALMDRHGLPANQFEEFSAGVHGAALLERGVRGAPHCASCHGSHEASKPGTIAVGNVCAQCHGLPRDLFVKSKHKAVHEEMGLPECEVCHGNHNIRPPTDAMLGTGDDALCTNCHAPESEGFKAAAEMRESIETIKLSMAAAETVVDRAAELGMDMMDARFNLHEASTRLTQARSHVHSFSAEDLEPIKAEGVELSQKAREQGEAAIEEFHFRRHGLWLTLLIVGVLVAGLVLAIREIESKK